LELSQSLKQNDRVEKIVFVSILSLFTIFAALYSLYTPSWEESDGWFHWSYTRAVAESELEERFYHRQQPLYYLISGGVLSILDPDILSDTSPTYTKRNIFEDFNVYRHTTEEKFPFEKSLFQSGCVGTCTDFEEEFPYSGIALGVHSLRIISIFYGLVTLVFIYKITNIVFPNNRWLSLTCLAFVAFIPHFIFINSVLGSTSLAITLVTISIYFLLKLVANPNDSKNLILLGIFVGIGLLTKIQTIFIVPAIYTTFVYLLYSKQIEKIQFLKFIGVFTGLFILCGGWWHILQFSFATFFFQTISGDVEAAVGSGTPIFQQFGALTMEKIWSNVVNYDRWHLIFFDTVWTGVGWKRISAQPIFAYLVKIFLTISLIGFILFIVRKFKLFSSLLQKKYLVVLVLLLVFETAAMVSIRVLFDLGSGRNLLPTSSAFTILVILGLVFFLRKKNQKILLIIPIAILFSINISLFFEMDEKYEHGLPRNVIHDANHFLLTEMWLGEYSGVQGNEPISKIRRANLEGGWRDTVLLLHPPKEGIKFWNFTMSIPDNKNYDIEIKYGFMNNAIFRSDPVEFRTYINGELVFQDEKTFTWNPETTKIKLDKYDENKVQVALATNAKDKGNNLAWSFFKLKFVE